MNKVTPSERIILIEPTDVKSGGGIEYVSEKRQEVGKIIEIGSPGHMEDGRQRECPFKAEIGDTVVYRRFGKDQLLFEGKVYLFIGFDDVVGVIKNIKK